MSNETNTHPLRLESFAETLHVGRPNIGNKANFLSHIEQMIDNRWLSNNGPFVQKFEENLAKYLSVKHVVAVCNGTVALEIAIRSLDLQGEIIVPSYTFVATAHAVYWQGIRPVFVDIDPVTHCIDPQAVLRAITPNTTGIIGVHLWGHPANTIALDQIARSKNLKVIYDSAHAFGVSSNGIMIGNFGNCEVFSFHATKFLNSLEGGAIATNDDELAEKARLIRNFGFKGFDNVIHPGTNGKMVEACAAMGLVNLESISEFVDINRRNYLAYKSRFATLPTLRLFEFNEAEKNNWQYVVVEVNDPMVSRDEIVTALHSKNVLARKYFWPGAHRMSPYKELFPWTDQLLSVTNEVAQQVIVLPTGTSVTLDDISRICDIIQHTLSQ